ncbi:hypothetical protein MANES_12G129950v8 [Manihot esculenta]|uniref:Uncharacterized protein n=1 Tax=Manihot esculenta TaxID=3983 RepID=A0ACB7GSA3_MANES|nr:hypothetical protein MANES_12G129950v8 [Manihot esculenta]
MSEKQNALNTGSESLKPVFSIATVNLQGNNNYVSWAASVELWFVGQGYNDYLTKNAIDITVTDRSNWVKIDAQLCSLLWYSLDPKLLALFQSCKTCCKIWTKAKTLYTNDIQRIYKLVSDIRGEQYSDMASYLGQVDTLKDEFNSLMPLTNDVDAHEGQRDKFFMVLALIGLRYDFCSVKDQILTGSVIPTLEDVSARLLRISLSKSDATDMESSVLAVQGNQGQGGNRKGKGKKFHCTYCDKKGHTRDACWALHGRPPRSNQSDNTEGLLPQPTNKSQNLDSITLIGEDYKKYLQFQAVKQHPPSTSIAHSGNSFACLTKSSPVGPWILDSGASDHISGPEYWENDWNRI